MSDLRAALRRVDEIERRTAVRLGPDVAERTQAVLALRRAHDDRQAEIAQALDRRDNFVRRHPNPNRSN